MRKLYPEALFISNTKDESVFISGMVRNWSIPGRTQFSSVTQSCLALCNPMDSSMPGLPVHHQLPEFTQTHVP